MARPVVLSNGSMFVGLDEHGQVHDFYYPYVGLENLTNARSVHHKIGVWVNGVFRWVDDQSWNISVDFSDDALVSNISFVSDELGITIQSQDFVNPNSPLFVRNFTIINTKDYTQEVRLFMHQVFQISRAGRADTALFVPEENYILDYKGRICLLISGQNTDTGQGFDQFSTGNFGIEGKEGTFKDAEDGYLEGCPVEHGGVDSVIRFSVSIEPNQQSHVSYWIAAAHSQSDSEAIHQLVKHVGPIKLLNDTMQWWHEWLAIGASKLHTVDKKYLPIVKKSLMVIKAHTDKHGGILASGDSSIYNYGRDYYSYVWPRDGAYAIWPLIRLGYKDEIRKFFTFCCDIMHKDGYMMHKYQPDKAVGSTWHPLKHGNHKELAIQEDETAILVYMLGEYYGHSKDDEFVDTMYTRLVVPAANFLVSFVDAQTKLPHSSYDLWEERFGTSTYTTAVVYQALLVAIELADVFSYPQDHAKWKIAADAMMESAGLFIKPDGVLRKGFLLEENGNVTFDDTLDVSSGYGAMMFGYFNEKNTATLHATMESVEQVLSSTLPSGGVARHQNDNYFLAKQQYPGNPWFVTTLWLAQYYLRIKQPAKAHSLIDWCLGHALPSGILSEQLDPENGQIISVTPLVWSHAELINTILDASHIE